MRKISRAGEGAKDRHVSSPLAPREDCNPLAEREGYGKRAIVAPLKNNYMFGPVKKLARLGQWNGRKRSTRQEPFFRRLGPRRALIRVAVVWLTTATGAGLTIWWGEPTPCRLVQTQRHHPRSGRR